MEPINICCKEFKYLSCMLFESLGTHLSRSHLYTPMLFESQKCICSGVSVTYAMTILHMYASLHPHETSIGLIQFVYIVLL